ncbi:MAG: decaprenyl-phosphate phosphoribosyltransferase [Deltaproteobacteria bacterium]|nr:MAG: decaprenyl-phosphate phosphoribosyltransferase [Deltaproteobacteria bacterium]
MEERRTASLIEYVRAFIETMRPHQWIKNLFLFAGIIFSEHLGRGGDLLRVTLAFLLFSLLSGAVYLINDLLDLEEDKVHPEKRHRPIASGRLPIPAAVGGVSVIVPLCLLSAFLLDGAFGGIAAIYFVQNLFYSKYLKHVVIIDVMMIGVGFVLRAVAGAVVIGVGFSNWLLLCTFLLALFLGFSKRRHELLLLEQKANAHRPILEHYHPYFLDMMISIVTAATLVSYALYTMSPETIEKFETDDLIYTIPFVVYGIFRYLYLVHLREEGGNPSRIVFKDKPLLVNILLWLVSVVLLVYLG